MCCSCCRWGRCFWSAYDCPFFCCRCFCCRCWHRWLLHRRCRRHSCQSHSRSRCFHCCNLPLHLSPPREQVQAAAAFAGLPCISGTERPRRDEPGSGAATSRPVGEVCQRFSGRRSFQYVGFGWFPFSTSLCLHAGGVNSHCVWRALKAHHSYAATNDDDALLTSWMSPCKSTAKR